MAFNFSKLSIIVIEDTAPMRKLIISVLETLGVGQIYSAENGEQGFELFRKFNPDIVISDWHMEPMNGLELTHEIRTNPLSPNRLVPIIVVSGYSATDRVSSARDVDNTKFLVKPFSANDLAKRLSYVINKPRDFIDSDGYFGPDRRRKNDKDYIGPKRREEDGATGAGKKSMKK